MVYENVNLNSPNMTGDRNNGYFYSFHSDAGITAMYQHHKNNPSDPINNTYPTSEDIINTVECVQFDGYYYWTLERQGSGIVVKKWELLSNILYKRSEFSFSSGTSITYDSYCFVVDYYSDYLSLQALAGQTSITVNDGSVFDPGDVLVLGPSTNGSFINQYEQVEISSIVGDVLTLSSSLTKSFGASDKVYTNRYFYVFNKYSPYDNKKGSLLKFDAYSGTLYSYSPSHMYGDVLSSCFYGDYILFSKGNEIVFINPVNLSVYKYMAIDNLDLNRADNVNLESLWAYSDVLYTLRSKYVYFDEGEDSWQEEDWGSKYNNVNVSLLPTAYFIEIKAEPDFIHAVAAPGVPSTTADVTVRVLDQYRVPIVGGVSVSLTSSYGSLSPNSGTTDSDTGEFSSTYTGTADAVDVQIKVQLV